MWLPFVSIPLVILLAVLAGDRLDHWGIIGAAIGNGAYLLAASPVLAGPPYAAFALGAYYMSQDWSVPRLLLAMNLSPVLFLVFYLAVAAVVRPFLADGPIIWREALPAIGAGSLLILTVGYLTVGLGHLLLLLGTRAGVVEQPA